MASECLSSRPEQAMLGNVNARFGNFFLGLEGVPAIRKKPTAGWFDEQKCRAATETAEITNVGEK